MGCGTGILGILASKLGAADIFAIDNDPLCYESTLENTILNFTENVSAICGSEDVIPSKQFDIILANINRNILLNQLERYAEVLNADGLIFLSGFYEGADLEMISQKATELNLNYIGHKSDSKWVAAKFSRI